MDTTPLKKFAQNARRSLLEQVGARMTQVLAAGSAARREQPQAVEELERQIRQSDQAQVKERVAYTWFNRFCALRFMDANRYTRIGIVSPAEGQVQPELLADAKLGHMDAEMMSATTQTRIQDLLAGKLPSRDPQAEAYRLLLVAACNYYAQSMPFLFERIYDYSELLLPDDLLSANSILAQTRAAMTPEACQDVEVIGWLYQFYISEKKDEVFEGLKKNKKITPENIPAATQLFTPHWIVRYLVENSLGRLWLLNRPQSRLAERMEYYIAPDAGPRMDTNGHELEGNIGVDSCRFVVNSPEELKICDPACGSGHMLVYAFDLLYAIYEEEGYAPNEIPAKILSNNLFGIEIDERAGALAAFALTMKARSYDRRFLSRKTPSGSTGSPSGSTNSPGGEPVEPQICVLQNIEFSNDELDQYMKEVGRDLFTMPLLETLQQFAQAKHFGSLIRPIVSDVATIQEQLANSNVANHLFLSRTHEKVRQVLTQADYLSPKYHVVIANPPYMGSKGMDDELKDFASESYPDSKSDTFAMFIERNLELTQKSGLVSMVTMQSWMFLSSFETLRESIIKHKTILSLIQIGYNSFPELNSKVAQACAFVLENSSKQIKGVYLDLNDAPQADDKEIVFLKKKGRHKLFHVNQHEFAKIPGSPIAYWVSNQLISIYKDGRLLSSIGNPCQGIATADNNRFVRSWHEVAQKNIGFRFSTRQQAKQSLHKWFPYNKGGDYRKWYGNQSFVIDWQNDGKELFELRPKSVIRNPDTFFGSSLSWSKVTSSKFSLRYFPEGFIYDVAGCSIFFGSHNTQQTVLGVMNSTVMTQAVNSLSPTLNFEVGQVANFPLCTEFNSLSKSIVPIVQILVKQSCFDWNSYETSWDFTTLPLLDLNCRQTTLEAIYSQLRVQWQEMTLEMQRLEQENNRIFINAYGLQDELTPDVPLSELTLTCNPRYRYGGDKSEAELEALLLADTMKEFISYAVGCMFGRYSLDKPGLILANQGETIEDYYAKVLTTKDHEETGMDTNGHELNPDIRVNSCPFVVTPSDSTLPADEDQLNSTIRVNSRPFVVTPSDISFPADADNAIPMLDGDWFADDIVERFRKFLRVTFGEDHYAENLAFIERALGKEIRKYFLRDFYNDHVRRYKKRPIYWLFSSPQGSFNVLIYMHRYRPDTVSVVLNDYLREFRTKLMARKSHLEAVSISASESQSARSKALKEIESLNKVIDELETYERNVLYPLATEQIQIDLDDGVRVNYLKFGAALKKIAGLEAQEE